MCAISLGNKVGIDVEEIREIPVSDFDREFSKMEMEFISNSADPIREFYKLWTQKEAFLKAIGSGLYVPLNLVSVIDNIIKWDETKWFLTEVPLPDTTGYISHLCTDLSMTEMKIKRIVF
ncbi:MAG: 4'-phosphopantetheinyl transferase superfamily protein [Ginsengibacter sp.]